VLRRGEASPYITDSPSHLKERGIKWVPRKIEDFSGCFKGDEVDK